MEKLPVVAALLCLCRAQSATYKRYDNYSVADFDDSPGFPVPSAADCLASSTASPLSNGAAFCAASNTCKLLSNTNNEIIVNLIANVGWVTYVKDISAQWRLVYKAQSAQSVVQSVANAFTASGGSFKNTFDYKEASTNLATSCGCTYRNDFINSWNVTQVQYQFVKSELTVASTVFAANGLNSTAWFAQKSLIAAAPYSVSNMRMQTMKSFTFRFLVDGSNSRDFAIWSSSAGGGCSGDAYYMMATNELDSTNCSYSTAPYPTLIYSATSQDSTALSPGALTADFLLISVKTSARVIGGP